MRLYAGMVIRSWKALEKETKVKQALNKKSAREFESLYKKAKNYYKNILKENLPDIYCKNSSSNFNVGENNKDNST